MKSPLVKDSGAIEQELGIFVRLPETAHKTALGYLKNDAWVEPAEPVSKSTNSALDLCFILLVTSALPYLAPLRGGYGLR